MLTDGTVVVSADSDRVKIIEESYSRVDTYNLRKSLTENVNNLRADPPAATPLQMATPTDEQSMM